MKKLFIILMIPLLAFALPVFADDSYGDIVFYEDFETLTSPKSGVNLTATLSDAFGGGSIMLYDGGSGSSYTIDSPISDGPKMLGVGGTVQYPQIMLPNLNITKAGKYTLAYDYYIPSALTPWFMQTGLSTTRRFNYVKGSLQTVVETFEIETGSGSTIPNIFIQAGKDTTVNEYYYIDNLRLYYLGEQLPETNYGLLLDSKDFEKTGSLDESLGTGGSGVYNFGTGATFSTEIPSGVSGADNMLKVTTTTQTSASAGYANMTIKRPGTYTVVFDCYIPSDYPLGWFKLKNSMEDVTISVQKGARSTYSAQIVLEEGKTLSQIFFQSYNYGSAINGSFYVDNIKLYLEPEEYLFSDFATNLVSTFIGDAKTERGFAWTSNTKCGDMVIRYAPSGPGLSGRYEEVSGYYEEYKDRYYYKADVTGLEPGVEYTYIIGTSEMNMWSDEYNFTTQAADTEEFSFIVVTDPQGSSQSSYTLFESVINAGFEKADDASFVVSLGDMVEHGYDESLWDMYFDAFDGKCAEIPNMAVLGNHEARADIAGKNFRLHFNHPDNGHDALKNLTASDMTNVYYKELVENIEESVYSFDYGNVHFAVINTGSDWAVSTDGLKLVKAQKEWLEADLEKSKAGWKVLMLHQGLYPAKEERYWGLREVFEDIVIEYDVDLVLQGHDHMVARTYPIADDKTPVITEDTDTVEKGSGTVYFIPGAAADKRYSDLETVPEYMLKVINTSSSEPVFSAIKVSASGLLVETINLSGEVIDSFEIVDNGQGDSVKPVRERLVYEDFEDVADGTVIFNSTDCGTLTAYKNSYINATNPGTASIYKDKLFSVTRGGDLNTSYVTTLDGNKVVRVDQRTDGASKNPQIGLYGGNTNENASLGITAAGTYTLKVDFYLPAEYASKINSFFVQTNVSETYTNTFIDVDNSATEGKWYTLTTDAVLDGTKEL
ncbi:MAG: metallophosphoesterase family protein, partial [Clostridia bacterium]|nr:metallophosphoesterase family protein [Clostridia bacterium]